MGRIGKPQKSRKHKKVRPLDPLSQEEGGSAHVRQRHTNQKPSNLEQEIPKKAMRLMASMKGQRAKIFDRQAGGVKKKHKKKKFTGKDDVEKRTQSGHKQIHETPDERNKMSKEVLQSADIIEQFKLDRTGYDDATKTKRAQKTKRRLKEHKIKEREKQMDRREERSRDFNQFKDEVKFGDVVHAPPLLSAVPRKANSEKGVPRPGKKSLLLKEIITTNSSHGQGLVTHGNSGRRQLGQTVKRKHLSMAKQAALDAERNKAIDLYREMKNKKMKAFS